jgi:hypothetical protein
MVSRSPCGATATGRGLFDEGAGAHDPRFCGERFLFGLADLGLGPLLALQIDGALRELER